MINLQRAVVAHEFCIDAELPLEVSNGTLNLVQDFQIQEFQSPVNWEIQDQAMRHVA
jgi:hypothetical protein